MGEKEENTDRRSRRSRTRPSSHARRRSSCPAQCNAASSRPPTSCASAFAEFCRSGRGAQQRCRCVRAAGGAECSRSRRRLRPHVRPRSCRFCCMPTPRVMVATVNVLVMPHSVMSFHASSLAPARRLFFNATNSTAIRHAENTSDVGRRRRSAAVHRPAVERCPRRERHGIQLRERTNSGMEGR